MKGKSSIFPSDHDFIKFCNMTENERKDYIEKHRTKKEEAKE